MKLESKSGTSVSRRTFTKGVAAVAATGLAVGSLTVGADADERVEEPKEARRALVSNPQYSFEYIPDPIPEEEITATVECDVVVVGAGVAGMAGIMYAADQGLDVHVVEKGPQHGVKRMCLAGINATQAIEDGCPVIDPMVFSREFFGYTGGFGSKLPLVTRYAKDSGHWIDWVRAKVAPLGYSFVTPGNARFDDGGIWPRYDTGYYFIGPDGGSFYNGNPPDYMELFYQIALSDGATFHFNEPGIRLEREGDMEGRVTGVITRNVLTGEFTRYTARLGVLLAAGDFFNDKEMVHKYGRYLEKMTTSIAEPNNTGDMCKAAMWVGAAMDDITAGDMFCFENAQCKNWIGPSAGEEGYDPRMDSCRAELWAPAVAAWPVLWVDDSGQRFCDETIRNFQMIGGPQVLTTPSGKVWSIWDSAWESKFPENYTDTPGLKFLPAFCANTQSQIEKEIEEGLIQRYDTLEELAAGCGFDPEIFLATIERYNYLAEQGFDLDCFKDVNWLFAVDTPPYYAARWGVMITSTRNGLKTDDRSRVYDTKGHIIPGLYAAGNQGGNFYGVSYPGGFGGTGVGHGQFYSWTAVRDMLGEDTTYLYDEEAKARIAAANA